MAIGFSPRCLTSMNQSTETWRRGTRITGVRHVQIHKLYTIPFLTESWFSGKWRKKWKETIILKGPIPFSTEPWWEESVHLAISRIGPTNPRPRLGVPWWDVNLSDTGVPCPQKGFGSRISMMWKMLDYFEWTTCTDGFSARNQWCPATNLNWSENIEHGLRFRGFKAFRSSKNTLEIGTSSHKICRGKRVLSDDSSRNIRRVPTSQSG